MGKKKRLEIAALQVPVAPARARAVSVATPNSSPLLQPRFLCPPSPSPASARAAPSPSASPLLSSLSSPPLSPRPPVLGGVLSLLLHHAAFRDEPVELSRLIASRSPCYDLNAVDALGNTPLHIAVMLRHMRCTRLLVDAGAKVSVKNRDGWNVLHEATSVGDRDTLRLLWCTEQKRQRESQELSGFLSHLESVPDFQVTFQWKVQSWLPLIGRWLPRDSITISKKGKLIRVDTHMLEFKGMQWLHHPYSFLIKPRSPAAVVPVWGSPEFEAESRNPRQPVLVFSLDHEERKWACVSLDDEKEAKESEKMARRMSAAMRAPTVGRTGAFAASAPNSPAISAMNSKAHMAALAAASAAAAEFAARAVDLEYELDDFMNAPIVSSFSPGRLTFKPINESKWNSFSAWTSFIGLRAAKQKVERVHEWEASMWRVEDIRVHMLKRLEHLSKEEVEELNNRGAAFKNMMTKPLALKAHLEQASAAEEEYEEEPPTPISPQGSSASSASVSAKPKRRLSCAPLHRSSLVPPPLCTVTFEAYFHEHNRTAYSAVDLEEVFDAQRDEALLSPGLETTEEEEVDLPAEEKLKGAEDADIEEMSTAEPSAMDLNSLSEAEIAAASSQPASPSPSASPPPTAATADASAMPSYSLLPDALAGKAPYIHLGRAMVEQVSRKKYGARLWMAKDFPLQMTTVVHVVELLFGTSIPALVAKFKHFVTGELPPGFPVRITVPVFTAISVDLAIASYEEGPDIAYTRASEITDDEAGFFAIPADYEREEQSEEARHQQHQKYRSRWKAADKPKQQPKQFRPRSNSTV